MSSRTSSRSWTVNLKHDPHSFLLKAIFHSRSEVVAHGMLITRS